MVYLSLRRWSGQFEIPGVLGKIRRNIAASVNRGECVVVMDDGAKGLTPSFRQQLEADWPPAKVRFSRVHPTLAPTGPRPRRHRRG